MEYGPMPMPMHIFWLFHIKRIYLNRNKTTKKLPPIEFRNRRGVAARWYARQIKKKKKQFNDIKNEKDRRLRKNRVAFYLMHTGQTEKPAETIKSNAERKERPNRPNKHQLRWCIQNNNNKRYDIFVNKLLCWSTKKNIFSGTLRFTMYPENEEKPIHKTTRAELVLLCIVAVAHTCGKKSIRTRI